METQPNEVVRMFLEHLSSSQRMGVARVCKIWNFLDATFPLIPKSFSFKKKIGTYGSSKNQFKYSGAAAINQTNKTIHIADIYNHRIQVFDENGEFLMMFGSEGNGDGQFNFVRSLGTKEVKFNNPKEVAINQRNGRIVVVEEQNHRIQIFDERGHFLSKFGSIGQSDGMFINPYGVAVDQRNGRIVVADKGNSRIQVFDESGDFLFKFGSKGKCEGQFDNPWSVAVNSRNGNIVVADTSNDRIQVFDESGQFLFTFGSKNDGIQFQFTIGVEVDQRNGFIFVSVDQNANVQVFNEKGEFKYKVGTKDQFMRVMKVGICEWNGNLIVPDCEGCDFQIFQPNF